MSEYYLLVAGSRGFKPYGDSMFNGESLCNMYITTILCNTMIGTFAKDKDIYIVQGDAYGADECGRLYASNNKYNLCRFPADWKAYGRGAGMIRNKQMFEYIDKKENKGVLLLWDGESHGTFNDIKLALRFGFDTLVYIYTTGELLAKDTLAKKYA